VYDKELVEINTRHGGKTAYQRKRKREVGEDKNFHAKSVAPNICRIFG